MREFGGPASVAESWPNSWLKRLMRELEALDGPLVQVWGWPGTGKRLLLRELAAQGGLEVPPVALRDAGLLRRAAREARQRNSSWILCRQWPHAADPVVPGPVLDELELRPLLIFTSHLRRPLDAEGGSVLGPKELLLRSNEVAELWRDAVDEPSSRQEVEDLLFSSEGWLRPLQLVAKASREGYKVTQDLNSWVSLPEVEDFFRNEVFEGVPLDSADQDGFFDSELSARGLEVFDLSVEAKRAPRLMRAFLENAKEPVGETNQSLTPVRPVQSGPFFEQAEAVDQPDFEVRLLGAPAIRRRGEDGTFLEVRWQLRRAFKIFAFLASRRGYQSAREELIEAVFPDEDPASIKRNFHPTLSYLRRNLVGESEMPQVVEYWQGTYRLNPEISWKIDAEMFEKLATRVAEHKAGGELEASIAAARRAWGLYGGPFLHGTYDSWAVERREALQRVYLRLLRDLGESYEALGRLPEALDAYRGVLVEDPLQESLQVAIMGIYASLGRRDLVRRQYDRLSSLLMEELGVEPLPGTTAEYHRLMG